MEPNDACAASCSRELSRDDPVGSGLGSVEQPPADDASCSVDSNAGGHCEVARANLVRDGVSLKRPLSSLPSEAVGRDLKSRDTRSDPEEFATRLLNSFDFRLTAFLSFLTCCRMVRLFAQLRPVGNRSPLDPTPKEC